MRALDPASERASRVLEEVVSLAKRVLRLEAARVRVRSRIKVQAEVIKADGLKP